MSLSRGSGLKNAHLHALILGSSFLISLTIILVRISIARRDSDASTEQPAATGGSSSSPKAAPAGAGGGGSPAADTEELLDRAEELYRTSALAEGRLDELGEAQRLLGQAGEILETLPAEDPRTRELRVRWSQLQQDVTRAAGF
jgi:hypothetical protein